MSLEEDAIDALRAQEHALVAARTLGVSGETVRELRAIAASRRQSVLARAEGRFPPMPEPRPQPLRMTDTRDPLSRRENRSGGTAL